MKLYDHQQRFVDFSKEVHYCILGDEVGLGKTLSSLTVAKNHSTKTLIICPAYLQKNWKIEADRVGIKPTIVSYAKIPTEGDFDCIIVDEAQYIKNMTAQRTKAIHKLVRQNLPDRLMLLSGTPILNSAGEWWSALLLMSLDPRNSNGIKVTTNFKTEFAFQRHFSNSRQFMLRGRPMTKFFGSKNLDQLKSILKGKYVKRSADKVLDLPEFSIQHIQVSSTEIKGLKEDFDTFQAGLKLDSSSKANSALMKAEYTANFARDLASSGPIVIFTDHLKPVEVIAEKLKDFKTAVITGATPMPARQQIVEEFQAGKIDYLIATIGSAATGITLTKSRVMIFNDLNWVSASNVQARGRIRRIGQKNNCLYYIICYGTVDKKISEVLIGKEELLSHF